MVLFTESETLRLLDLYVELQAEPANVTSNGVLLKLPAREELTQALNDSFQRERPWTESQVSVKVKNLRSDFAEYKWLTTQPGFRKNGKELSDEWWGDIKNLRAKAHVFKGKLPWPLAAKMEQIVSNGVLKQERQLAFKSAVQRQLKEELVALKHVQSTDYAAVPVQVQEQTIESVPPVEVSKQWAGETVDPMVVQTQESDEATAPVHVQLQVQSSNEGASPTRSLQHKRKRNDSIADSDHSRDSEESTADARDASRGSNDCEYLLARSMEQSAMVAVAMAQGVQNLITMYQKKAVRCRMLERQAVKDDSATKQLAEERSSLSSIARSLEHSTRAAADITFSNREIVDRFLRETDVER